MKQHKYRVTLEYLQDGEGNPMDCKIEFAAPNHDNIFHIIDLMATREGFTPEMAQRFAVGLKLMGEVMMENRDVPLFNELKPHFKEMMKIIKGKRREE